MMNEEDEYVSIGKISDVLLEYANNCFEEMFKLCPNDYGKVIEKDREIVKKRYHKSYMNTPQYDPVLFSNRGYMFSGKNDDNNEYLPEIFKPFLDFINDTWSVEYNQVVVNWFKSGDDYIPLHIDHVVNMDEHVPIITLSLGDSRIFRIKENESIPFPCDDGIVRNIKPKKDYICKNGDIIILKKNNIVHGIPWMKEGCSRRISISFRKYI